MHSSIVKNNKLMKGIPKACRGGIDMATKYSYPRVEEVVKAITHTTTTTEDSSATTLLAPFICDRGPENVLYSINSMSDFTSLYGTLDYTVPNERQILNIGAWLEAGGRVLACRLTDVSLANTIIVSGAKDSVDTNTYYYHWAIKNGKSMATEDTDNSKYIVKITYVPAAGTVKEYLSVSVKNYDSSTASTVLYALDSDDSLSTHSKALLTAGVKNTDITKTSESVTTITDGLDNIVSVSYDGYVYLSIPLYSGDSTTTTGTAKIKFTSKSLSSPSASDIDASAVSSVAVADGYSGTAGGRFYASAKYSGSYYNGLEVDILTNGPELQSDGSYEMKLSSIVIYDSEGNALESFSGVDYDAISSSIKDSLYLGKLTLLDSSGKEVTSISSDNASDFDGVTEYDITLGSGVSGTDVTSKSVDDLLGSGVLDKILDDPLSTPFDVMIDCGYSEDTKLELIKLFCGQSDDLEHVYRNDAFLAITPFVIKGNGKSDSATDETNGITEIEDPGDTLRPSTIDGVTCDYFNMAIFGQYEKIEDEYSAAEGSDVFVPTTYYLAKLWPYNDLVYGPQYPSAGLTRGVITYEDINSLPAAADKENYYDNCINYVEKDSRGSYIMCNLTGETENNALVNINNVRALLKMKKDLVLLGRQYLFEFNDTTTKQNLSNVLNSYLATWIQNRTLSDGNVTIYDSNDISTLSSKQIEILLDVTFTDTIEVITVKIVVE